MEQRTSTSESELIGQVENDQRARRVIDRTHAGNASATQGEWMVAAHCGVRSPDTDTDMAGKLDDKGRG